MTRWLAYGAYLAGSLLFVAVALHRGSPILAVGSGLFAIGTLLHLMREIDRTRLESSRQ